MTTRSAIKMLLLLVLGLPLLLVVLAWINSLLVAMGDTSAVSILDRTCMVGRVIWLLSLVAMVVLLAVRSADETDRSPPDQA